jgi:hypothetical protein
MNWIVNDGTATPPVGKYYLCRWVYDFNPEEFNMGEEYYYAEGFDKYYAYEVFEFLGDNIGWDLDINIFPYPIRITHYCEIPKPIEEN